jgi:hypothetical protein
VSRTDLTDALAIRFLDILTLLPLSFFVRSFSSAHPVLCSPHQANAIASRVQSITQWGLFALCSFCADENRQRLLAREGACVDVSNTLLKQVCLRTSTASITTTSYSARWCV